jgi:polysaccharide biosynthesis transport protein
MHDAHDARQDRHALPPGEVNGLDRRAELGLRRPEPATIYGTPIARPTHLSEHWRILMRHRWLVIGFLIVTVAATALWTFTTRPRFVASVVLRIEKDEPRVVKFEDVLKVDTATEDYYQTQYGILQSRSLAETVIQRLGLDKHPEFEDPDRTWFDDVRDWVNAQFRRLTPATPEPPADAAKDELTVSSPVTDAFLRRVTVDPVRNSRLVRVGFESYHPYLAAKVANALATTYIEQQLDQKTAATRYAADFLGKQLADAGARLKTAETRLNAFLKANNIFFINSEKTGEQQDLITQQMSQISDSLLKARSDRIAKESLYRQAVAQKNDSLPAVLGSPLVSHLKEELANSEAEYKKLGQTFKPEYPRMQQLQRSINELRQQLSQEVRRILDGVESDYQAAVNTERQLQQSIDSHQQLVRKLGDQMPQYSVLRRDVDTNRQVYITLLTRLKETQVSSALITSNISLIDRAEIPRSPSKPRTMLNLVLGVIVGLAGGVALAFVVEYFDTTVKDANEINDVLRVPALGTVPRAALRGQRPLLDTGEERGHALPGLTHRSGIDPMFADAFRTLRTSLLYASSEPAPGTFMVTSPQRGEGKTTIASNLAVALAQHGGEVLVIDADLRCPTLHDVFDCPPSPGFSNFLSGDVELSEVIQETDTSNLFLVPAGRRLGTLSDLLASPRFRPAVEGLTQRFKYIVFDTTPLFGISDALSLAPHVGGVLLVLRHGHANRSVAQRAVRLLDTVGTPIMGIVLNRFNPKITGTRNYDYPSYGAVDDDLLDDGFPFERRRGA